MSNGPWLAAFRVDPDQAVDDLFSGRAGVGSSLRLDIPEFLYQAFPPSLADERRQLDGALSNWLDRMREDYATQVARLGFPVYGKRLGDALIALQLLDLPETRCRIRADLDTWLRWLLPLRLAPERDPALECWRLLTRDQPGARYTAMWLRLASDPRPEHLTVALVGLQLLPNQDDARTNQKLMLQALLRHAVSTRPDVGGAGSLFRQRYAALRGLFPRSPSHWDRVLLEVLDSFAESAREPMAIELAQVLRDRRTAGARSSGRPLRRRGVTHAPVPIEEVDRLMSDIQGTNHPPEVLARRLFGLLERNHRHAEATGASYYFVRTLNRLGHRLLQRHRLGEAEMARLGIMIERALVWEPMEPYCWMLWADWFGAQGRPDAREWTLREMLRLFPDDEPSRVELARLLMRRGVEHWDEAEHWLRGVVERNPDDEHARVELARLLMRRGVEHWDEGEQWLREAAERSPNHGHARVELARLLMHRGEEHWDEAEHWLWEVVERNPDDEHARSVMAELEARRGREEDSGGLPAEIPERLPATPIDFQSPDQIGSGMDSAGDGGDSADYGHPTAPLPAALEELARRGRLASEFSRARIARVCAQATSTEQIRQEALRGDPLAGFYSQWLMPNETPECPPHAWAWKACRYWQESALPACWRHLKEEFPEAAKETVFLRLLAAPATPDEGDDQSGLAGWRTGHGSDDDTAPSPILAFMHRQWERIGEISPGEREELACAVMAHKAADVPEFAPERAG